MWKTLRMRMRLLSKAVPRAVHKSGRIRFSRPWRRAKKSTTRQTLDYLSQLDALHKAGMGIMILHWGVAVNNEQNPTARDYYLDWFGRDRHGRFHPESPGFLDRDAHRKRQETSHSEWGWPMDLQG